MHLWLFFTIFGLVLFVPTTLIFLLLNRFKNTIVVLLRRNGHLVKVIITNEVLAKGKITEIKGKKVTPINISKDEIYFGTWRRWIVKPELDSKLKSNITDKEIEEYLNNEDLIKLYLAGKFKDTLIILLSLILGAVIISGVINGWLTTSHQCIISQDNSTKQFIVDNVKLALNEFTKKV